MLFLKEDSSSGARVTPLHNETAREEGLFDPPLYKQRYAVVADIVNTTGAKRVMDIGCSEGQFLPYVKNLCPRVEELYGIDVDRHLLERNSHRIRPFTQEFILKRKSPLTISLLHGSITQPDLSYVGIDFVSCIEVIEHLYEEDLKIVPDALFGRLQPKTVVITTPNSEYNVLFKDFSGMRHWDHKFEWSRMEFENWCQDIVSMYPMYSVYYGGVGEPPVDRQDVGYCSQFAVFSRTLPDSEVTSKYSGNIASPAKDLRDTIDDSKYITVESVVYPFDNTSRDERVKNEVSYLINHCFRDTVDELEGGEDVRNISITELLSFVSASDRDLHDLSKDEFIEILKDSSYKLSNDQRNVVVEIEYDDRESDDERFFGDDVGDEFDEVTSRFSQCSTASGTLEEECWEE